MWVYIYFWVIFKISNHIGTRRCTKLLILNLPIKLNVRTIMHEQIGKSRLKLCFTNVWWAQKNLINITVFSSMQRNANVSHYSNHLKAPSTATIIFKTFPSFPQKKSLCPTFYTVAESAKSYTKCLSTTKYLDLCTVCLYLCVKNFWKQW